MPLELGAVPCDLEPTPRQAAQLSVSKPQCSCFCLLHRLVINSGEEGRRQSHPAESYAVEETGGNHNSRGRFPGWLILKPSQEGTVLDTVNSVAMWG